MKKCCNLQKELSHGVKYWIFRTKWGYCGIAGDEKGLLRTLLPQANREEIKRQILKAFPGAKSEKRPFSEAVRQITSYFAGKKANFAGLRIDFNGSQFSRKVLNACQKIAAGSTISYRQLAEKAGRPGAARAVGSVMAKNPVPLIIPCHRVVRGDGKIGNFSAPGGAGTKKKLISLESKQ